MYASHTPVTLGLDQKSHTETTALGSSDDQLSDTSNVPVCLEDSLGIGQVARLGRVRAARVIIGHLLFTDNAQKILGFPTGLSSRIPRSKRMLQATKVTAGLVQEWFNSIVVLDLIQSLLRSSMEQASFA